MAIYKVQGPDGKEHELEGPEGATDEQIIAKAQEAFGSEPQGSPEFQAAIEADKQGLQDVSISDAVAAPFMLADAAGEGAAVGLGKAGHPTAGAVVGTGLSMLPYIPAAAAGIKAAPAIGDTIMAKAGNVRSGLAEWFAKKAEEQAIKSASPTTTNLEQIGEKLGAGPESVRATGRYMLDKGIVTPYVDAETMAKRVAPLDAAAGQDIGYIRDLASKRAQAPTPEAIKELVGKELGSKYGPGLRTGEQGSLNNAVDELVKQNPKNFEELSGVATDLNSFAKSPRSLTQPQEATTDVANLIARESDAGIKKVLNPGEQIGYDAAKQEFGTTQNIKTILDRSQYRDIGSNTNIPLSHTGRVTGAINAVMPASTRATVADKIANALRVNPQAFGRNGQALQRAMQAGKASLNSVIYMLQQQDPEFKSQFEEMNRSGQ